MAGSGTEEPGLAGVGVEEPGLTGSGIGEPGLGGAGAEESGLAGSGVGEPGLAGSGIGESGLTEVEFFVLFIDELIWGSRNCSHPAIINTEKSAAKITREKNKVFVCTEIKPLFHLKTILKTADGKSEVIPRSLFLDSLLCQS